MGRLVLHTFNSSQDSRKISNFINFSVNSFKIFLILGSFSLIRVLYLFAFIVKIPFVFNFIRFYKFYRFCFAYSACITIIYSLNLILYLFNFGSNLILTVILTYNRKIFNYLLILIFLNFI